MGTTTDEAIRQSATRQDHQVVSPALSGSSENDAQMGAGDSSYAHALRKASALESEAVNAESGASQLRSLSPQKSPLVALNDENVERRNVFGLEDVGVPDDCKMDVCEANGVGARRRPKGL